MPQILSWFCSLSKHQAPKMRLSEYVNANKNCFRLFPLWIVDSFLVYEQTPNSQLQRTGEGIVVRPALNTHPHRLSDTQPLQTGIPWFLHTIIILIHVFVKFHRSLGDVFRKLVLGHESQCFDIENEMSLFADHSFVLMFYLVCPPLHKNEIIKNYRYW